MNGNARRIVRSVLIGLAWAAMLLLVAVFAGGGEPFIYIAF